MSFVEQKFYKVVSLSSQEQNLGSFLTEQEAKKYATNYLQGEDLVLLEISGNFQGRLLEILQGFKETIDDPNSQLVLFTKLERLRGQLSFLENREEVHAQLIRLISPESRV